MVPDCHDLTYKLVPANHVYANIIADGAWVEGYIAKNRQLLAANYRIAVAWARKHRITYAPGSNSAFFLWINLGKAYRDRQADTGIENNEDEAMNLMLDHKVFVAAGRSFGAEEEGWFRLVFSVDKETLMEGLKRITTALGLQPFA